MFGLFHSNNKDLLKEKIERLETEKKYWNIFQDITLTIVASLDFEEITQKIVDLIVDNFNYASSVLFIIPEKDDYMYSHTVSNVFKIKNVISQFGKPFREHKANLKTDNCLVIKSAREKMIFEGNSLRDFVSPALSKQLSNLTQKVLGIKRSISYPLITKGVVLGVIMFNSRKNSFSDNEKKALESFVKQLAIAINNARLFQESQNRLDQINKAYENNRAFAELGKIFVEEAELQPMCQKIVDKMVTTLNAVGGVIFLLDNKQEYVESFTISATPTIKKALSLLPLPFNSYKYSITNPEGYVGLTAKEQKVFQGRYVHDFLKPNPSKVIADGMQHIVNANYFISLPIIANNKLLGVSWFAFKEKEISEETHTRLRLFQNLISLAISNTLTYANTLKLAQEQRDIIDVMGHELRTPITAIYQEAKIHTKHTLPHADELLKDAQDSEKLQRYLPLLFETIKTVDTASTHAIALIHDMLETARLDKQHIELYYERFNLTKVIESTIEVFGKTTESEVKGIKVTIDFNHSPHNNIEIEADKTRIQQALYALLHNAIKYHDPKKKTLHVSIDLEIEEKNLKIQIKDNGIGIKKEDLSKLGQKFMRLNQYMTGNIKRPGGTGLGLYVVKGIIEHHNGKLIIESPGLGKGSTFSLVLPTKKQKR